MIRLLHLADLHPNNAGTLAGKTVADPETGLNLTLIDLQRSLQFVYDVATAPGTRCDLAVLPGDLFDSPRPHMNEVRIIKDFVVALAREMPVCIIPGNHDLSQNTNDASALACLEGLPGVYIRESPDTIRLHCASPSVLVSFLPFPTKGRLLTEEGMACQSPEAIMAAINAGLVDILRGMATQTVPGSPHLLLAHGSVSGSLQVGEQPRSLAHDIQIPRDELAAFDYVALGHIHQGQPLNDANAVWYSGSLMRQSFGEEKEPKGFNLVSLEADGPHVVFVENPHARVYCTVTVADLSTDGVEVLSPASVVRVKDRLTSVEYDAARAELQNAARVWPYLQQDIEIVAPDRARDAGMAAMLTIEATIRRVLSDVPEEEMAGILGKHEQLEREVGA